MELAQRQSDKKVQVLDSVFACDFNEPLVHQVITAHMAGARAGTKGQKTRAEVRGGGAKPWRQKGTGQARAGTIRSPIWRGGGATFAAQPRCYKQKVNKKMFKGALRAIYSELIRQDRLSIINPIELATPKTKQFLEKLSTLKLEGRIVIIMDDISENMYLAARNLINVEVIDVVTSLMYPTLLVKADHVVVTEAALKEVERSLV